MASYHSTGLHDGPTYVDPQNFRDPPAFRDPPTFRGAQGAVLYAEDYDLSIRQGPERGRVSTKNDKARKPIDPPPIVQLIVDDSTDINNNYLQNPYYFCMCFLWDEKEDEPAKLEHPDNSPAGIVGAVCSSMNRMKDVNNEDGGFFVWGDISVKVEGHWRLRFCLFEMCNEEVQYIKSVTSKPFEVFAPKSFPGMAESTFLSRSFADQGIKIRTRKETRQFIENQRAEDKIKQAQQPYIEPSTKRRKTLASNDGNYSRGNAYGRGYDSRSSSHELNYGRGYDSRNSSQAHLGYNNYGTQYPPTRHDYHSEPNSTHLPSQEFNFRASHVDLNFGPASSFSQRPQIPTPYVASQLHNFETQPRNLLQQPNLYATDNRSLPDPFSTSFYTPTTTLSSSPQTRQNPVTNLSSHAESWQSPLQTQQQRYEYTSGGRGY